MLIAGTNAPFVIAEHASFGRINLTRAVHEVPPPIGALLEIEGLEVRPGGVVQTQAWRVARRETNDERVATTIRLPHTTEPVRAADEPKQPLTPRRSWNEGRPTVRIVCPVEVNDIDSSEIVEDADVLASYDGFRDDFPLLDIPCLAAAAEAVPVWATDGRAELHFDARTSTLECHLVLSSVRTPAAPEIERLVQSIRRELGLSGWASNLDWSDGQDHPEQDSLSPFVAFERAFHGAD